MISSDMTSSDMISGEDAASAVFEEQLPFRPARSAISRCITTIYNDSRAGCMAQSGK